MPRLILCADDFGLSTPISEAIADLAAAGQISATSCMAACPGWMDDSAMLKALPRRVETGLHLVLASETPITDMPILAPEGRLPGIDRLKMMALRGQLPLAELAAEISAQFQRFAEAMGRPPDFVDGHQHSHVLPAIRQLVIAATRQHAPQAWLRDCSERIGAIAVRPFRGKALASAATAIGFARSAARAGLACNSGFAGHYGFAGDYAAIFPGFLMSPGAAHLVMCHPGAGALAGDTIADARRNEYAALQTMPIGDMAAVHGLSFNN
jgi:predicted glycoside hydrolase/deacetylase ChbG (UPF0249 family)